MATADYAVSQGSTDLKELGRKVHAGVILPARDYEDAAEIHGRPRILADFEKKQRQQSILQRARERIRER